MATTEGLRQFRESAAALVSQSIPGFHHIAGQLDSAATDPALDWPHAAHAADEARALAAKLRDFAALLRKEG